MGGDHTVVLPILRSINAVYGPISVIVSLYSLPELFTRFGRVKCSALTLLFLDAAL